jgi:hypothetical protein
MAQNHHVPELHVESLRYILQPDERFSYDNPPPLEFETAEARFRLANGVLTCEMKIHFSDANAARNVVEPVLRAWEALSDVRYNRGQLRFRFDQPQIVDRSPRPPGSSMMVAMSGSSTFTATLSFHVTSKKYPEPPRDYFRLNPDAESILQRYRGYLDGREPLQSMTYFCLTIIERGAGSRNAAAAQYQIDNKVLRKIGELSSTRGDNLTARKAVAAQPLSAKESSWLEAVVKILIQRIGDSRDPAQLPLITMSDLAPL